MPQPLPLFPLSFLVAASAAVSNNASTAVSTAAITCWRRRSHHQHGKELKVTHVVAGLFSLPVITCDYTCERHKKIVDMYHQGFFLFLSLRLFGGHYFCSHHEIVPLNCTYSIRMKLRELKTLQSKYVTCPLASLL